MMDFASSIFLITQWAFSQKKDQGTNDILFEVISLHCPFKCENSPAVLQMLGKSIPHFWTHYRLQRSFSPHLVYTWLSEAQRRKVLD